MWFIWICFLLILISLYIIFFESLNLVRDALIPKSQWNYGFDFGNHSHLAIDNNVRKFEARIPF